VKFQFPKPWLFDEMNIGSSAPSDSLCSTNTTHPIGQIVDRLPNPIRLICGQRFRPPRFSHPLDRKDYCLLNLDHPIVWTTDPTSLLSNLANGMLSAQFQLTRIIIGWGEHSSSNHLRLSDLVDGLNSCW